LGSAILVSRSLFGMGMLYSGDCGRGENPSDLVGTWLPLDGGRGFTLGDDGYGGMFDLREHRLWPRNGVPFIWDVKGRKLRFKGIGEEGETGGPWSETSYSLSADRKRLTLSNSLLSASDTILRRE
jgi:hypothetical protein